MPLISSCSPKGSASSSPNLNDQLAQGKILYEQSCAQCHYEGSGNPVAPDLLGSAVLSDAPQILARQILTGQQGVSMKDGVKFNGFMPALDSLRDDEIAAVVVYVRDTFGNRREAFSPQTVSEVRASLNQ